MSHEFTGYECATIVLVGVANFFRDPSVMTIPIILIGWINPLLLLYLVAGALKRLRAARPFIAGAVGIGCITMWILLGWRHGQQSQNPHPTKTA